MFSSGNLNESTVSSPHEEVNHLRPLDVDGQEDESSAWNADRMYFSESVLTVGVEMNVQSLPLIHQNPTGWHFVTANLKLIAAGKSRLDAILHVIEMCLEEFSLFKEGLNVEILRKYFDSLNSSEKNAHQAIFCELAKLILETPKLFPDRVNLLIPNDGCQKIDLSRTQCLCLVAHMFMCISLPPYKQRIVHFGYVFHKGENAEKTTESVQINKIKCLMNYFAQALKEEGERKVLFERIVADKVKSNVYGEFYKIADEECHLEGWEKCTDKLIGFSYKDGKTVGGSKTIEIGFSSKAFGGQTLISRPQQQEIRILQSPECLIGSMLFPGQLGDGEAFVITGARHFNKCDGTEEKFEFKSNYKEDSSEFSQKKISFIDAFNFKLKGTSIMQFSPQGIQREITKAFIGFAPHEEDGRSVSTGGWGTGYYNGNMYSKFLFQWMAASRAKRKMEFYSYKNPKLGELIDKLKGYYEGKEVGELMRDLLICAGKAPQENNSKYDLFLAMKNEFSWK